MNSTETPETAPTDAEIKERSEAYLAIAKFSFFANDANGDCGECITLQRAFDIELRAHSLERRALLAERKLKVAEIALEVLGSEIFNHSPFDGGAAYKIANTARAKIDAIGKEEK